jgi:SAM-dependent methyltransferase
MQAAGVCLIAASKGPVHTLPVPTTRGVRRLPEQLLEEMATVVNAHDRDEMAIPSYRHSNPAMRWMAWRRVEVVAKYIRDLGRERGQLEAAMDFGCGTGVLFETTSAIADKVYGVDLVLEPAELLVERWQLDRVQLLDPEQAQTEIADDSLDLIVAAEVLEHIDELDDTLRFFESKLKSDGRLIVSLPTESLLYRAGRRLAGFSGHYHHHNAKSIHDEITRFGFRSGSIEKVPLGGPLSIYWVISYRPPAR